MAASGARLILVISASTQLAGSAGRARMMAQVCSIGTAISTRAASTNQADACAQSSFSSRSEEHTSELQSLMRSAYAVFCLNKKKTKNTSTTNTHQCHTQ